MRIRGNRQMAIVFLLQTPEQLAQLTKRFASNTSGKRLSNVFPHRSRVC
jgi:hypothetical protein